jgi:hypothetical protein
MFSTSIDVLNLVLAVSIAVLTIFLVSAIYYIIVSVKKLHRLINKIEAGVSKTEETISLIREKIKGGSAYLMILAEVAKQAIKLAKNKDWFSKKEERKSRSKKTKKK